MINSEFVLPPSCEKLFFLYLLLFMDVCMLSHVQLLATLWTITCQAPLSMGFSRQEYWSRLPCLSAGELPDPEIKPATRTSPVLAGRFFTTSAASFLLAPNL